MNSPGLPLGQSFRFVAARELAGALRLGFEWRFRSTEITVTVHSIKARIIYVYTLSTLLQ